MNHILLLEDNNSLSSYWRGLLESNRYQVRCCATVSEALELVLDRAPDLLIADMMIKQNNQFIPEGGITLLHKLAAGGYKSFPVLGVSGYKANNHRSLSVLDIAQSMGIDQALYKPITAQTLLQSVSELLHGAKSRH